jgi:hypothetical protein
LLFIAKYPDGTNVKCFGQSSNGIVKQILPEGSKNHNYNLTVFVEIYDNEDAVTVYQLESFVQVKPDNELIRTIMAAINSQSGVSNIEIDRLASASTQDIANILSSLSNSLDSTMNTGSNVQLTPEQIETERNNRAQVRESLFNYVNNVSIPNIKSAQMTAQMLAELTKITSEIPRESADKATNQIIRLILAIENFDSITDKELMEVSTSMMNSIGNIGELMTSVLNGKISPLNSDVSVATTLTMEYNVDIEDYWNNLNNFEGDTYIEQMINKNIKMQKQMVTFNSIQLSF